MKDIFPENKLNYILRLYLPTWNHEKIVDEIIEFCKETGTEYVMFFTDAQHMVWNQLTLEEARHEAENIAKAVKTLAKHNIHVGINSSYNMRQSRFDHSEHNPQYTYWQTRADGSGQKHLACQLEPALKDYLTEFQKILASAGAEYIYIDDDNRYIMTGEANTWGCMCDLHISRFSECSGKNWTRETLQHAIYNDTDVRRQWINFLNGTLEDIAGTIADAAHSIDPDIKVGIMVPCLHTMTICNYDLTKIAKRVQKEGKVLLRPCIGPYSDNDRQQIIPGLFYMQIVGHLMGDNAEYTPEIETTPFSRFSKSMEVIRLHISQGIINRMFNPAISPCGYVGNGPFFEPEIPKMLKRERAFFEGLIKIAPERHTKKGIGLKFSPTSAFDTNENHPAVTDYYWPSFAIHDFLGNSGFCMTYDDSEITFIAGDTAWSLSDEEIKKLLAKNLILDANAAKAFAMRGYKEQIGCSIAEIEGNFGAEYFTDPEFCGKYVNTYASLKNAGLRDVKKIVDIADNARTLAVITDHDRRTVCPSMLLFENSLGGKVAVMAYRINPMTPDMRHLISYQKQTLMRNIIEYMDMSAIPLFVENPSCFAVQYFDNGQNILAGMTNISYDIAHEITVVFNDSRADVANAKYLNEDGQMLPLSNIAEKIAENKWKIRKDLAIFHYFAIQIPRKSS